MGIYRQRLILAQKRWCHVRRSLRSRYDRQVWVLLGGSLISSFGSQSHTPSFHSTSSSTAGCRWGTSAWRCLSLPRSACSGSTCPATSAIASAGKRSWSLAWRMNTDRLRAARRRHTRSTSATLHSFCCYVSGRLSGGLYRNIPNVMMADLVGPRRPAPGPSACCASALTSASRWAPCLGGLMALYSYTAMFAAAAVASAVYLAHCTVPDARHEAPAPDPVAVEQRQLCPGRPPVPCCSAW